MSTSDDYEEVAHLTQWLKKSRDKHEVLGGLDTNKNPSICERGVIEESVNFELNKGGDSRLVFSQYQVLQK